MRLFVVFNFYNTYKVSLLRLVLHFDIFFFFILIST